MTATTTTPRRPRQRPRVPWLTTGRVAGLVGVSARTVCKWADRGYLQHWKLPTKDGDPGEDRRFDPRAVALFCRQRDIPVPRELARHLPDAARVLVCSPDLDLAPHLPGVPVAAARTQFDAGLLARDLWPDCVVIDGALGPGVGIALAAGLRRACGWAADAQWVYVAPEDCWGDSAGEGMDVTLVQPVSAAAVAEVVLRCVGGDVMRSGQ
jgi:hypothetical protein